MKIVERISYLKKLERELLVGNQTIEELSNNDLLDLRFGIKNSIWNIRYMCCFECFKLVLREIERRRISRLKEKE